MPNKTETNYIAGDPKKRKPLPLADEQRIENYEILNASTGLVVEVTHNLDTGEFDYTETARTRLANNEPV